MIQQILMTGLLFTTPSPAQPTLTFSGRWERDPETSDDAKEKMQAAMQAMRDRMERRGGMRPGGGMPPSGGMAQAGARPGGREGRPRPQIGSVPESFSAELKNHEFHIDDGERVQIYYLDGEKHIRQTPNGMELETISEMRGASIHVEEKMRRGEMKWEYELSPDGQTMIVNLTLKMNGMKDPVIIRTVYQRTDAGEESGF
jgi:hypothetical protein